MNENNNMLPDTVDALKEFIFNLQSAICNLKKQK